MLGQFFREAMLANPVTEYTNKLKSFKEKFAIFKDIEVGDKIGKTSDDNYYIAKAGYLLSVRRWWANEDRVSTLEYLDADFLDFFNLCDNIKSNQSVLTPNATIKKTLIEIINIVIPGLYNLKKSYIPVQKSNDDANKLCCKIDSIILTLIDTKTEINKEPITATLPLPLNNGLSIPIRVQAVSHSF